MALYFRRTEVSLNPALAESRPTASEKNDVRLRLAGVEGLLGLQCKKIAPSGSESTPKLGWFLRTCVALPGSRALFIPPVLSLRVGPGQTAD